MEIFTPPPTAKGPAETFTGDVWMDLIHAGPQAGRACLSLVRFAPRSRSHWHSHRLGQTLHIIDGIALLGSRDGRVIEARPGDAIYAAPGEEHWRGAALTASWPTSASWKVTTLTLRRPPGARK